MKLVGKFALLFLVASCALLGMLAYRNAVRAAQELRASAETDLRAFGDGLREGIATVWASQGEMRATDLIHAERGKRGDVEIIWVAAERTVTDILSEDVPDSHMLTLKVPVQVRGEVVGMFVLRRRVRDLSDVFRTELYEELALTGGMAVVLGVLLVGLGNRVIGQPLRRVVEQAQRIGGGDLSARLTPASRDELGDLAVALNNMCDRLASARTQLEHESTARIETLEQLRHLDRLRTVGTLATSLAHELGTPLNVLLLRGQAIAAGELEAKELADAGKTIATQVAKMSGLVRQLLDFSRRAPAKGDVRLSQVARQAVDLLSALARKAGVTATVDVREDAVINGAAVQLEQAVTNLVVNAIHAMPKGGALQLRVGVSEGAHATATAAPTRAGYIAVQDQGAGIEAAQLSRIFEPFYTTRPAGEGTGLGLSVARGIAQEHGGWIAAESEVTRGSTFTIFIPLAS